MVIQPHQIVAFGSGVYVVKAICTEEIAVLLDTQSSATAYVYAPTKHLKRIPQFDESEVWIETALLIGDMVRLNSLTQDLEPTVCDEDDQKKIRTHCYQLLGGNNITITEDVKTRVRELIHRAVERTQLYSS